MDHNLVDIKYFAHLKEFTSLAKKINNKQPSNQDIKALENWIDSNPAVFHDIWNLSKLVRNDFIDTIAKSNSNKMILRKEVEILSRELGGDSPSDLEKLIIENILISWLRLQQIEIQINTLYSTAQISMKVVQFWEKRLSVAQQRYIRACESLARIRNLARKTPSLQVNIATERGQQVNIAGNYERGDPEK